MENCSLETKKNIILSGFFGSNYFKEKVAFSPDDYFWAEMSSEIAKP